MSQADRDQGQPLTPEAVTDAANPNGSLASIAGVCSKTRNVVGLMPHPERACDTRLGSDEGLILFKSVIDAFASRGTVAV